MTADVSERIFRLVGVALEELDVPLDEADFKRIGSDRYAGVAPQARQRRTLGKLYVEVVNERAEE